jgi:ABC-2 type transport system ATP-binding protein
MLSITNLHKTYDYRERSGFFRSRVRQKEALKGIDLEVQAGEFFGLLGPNGAGKTTLLKCIATLLLPTSGELVVNGCDSVRDADGVRASLGCLLNGDRGLYVRLTGRENLAFFAAMYGVTGVEREQRVDELSDLLRLGDFIDRGVATYSLGQRMKLAFARALVNRPPLLVLDEPTNGLDVPSARELRAIVQELNQQGRTVLYSTHQMIEAEALCQRLAILDQGRIIALGTVEELKATLQQETVVQVTGLIPEMAYRQVLGMEGVRNAVLSADSYGRGVLRIATKDPQHLLPALIQALYREGAKIEDINAVHATLEDVFVGLTGRMLEDEKK